MRIACLLLVFLGAAFAQAAPQDGVVRVSSHGASASVIYSSPGRSYILGCAHAFQGADRNKPIQLDIPHPEGTSVGGAQKRPGVRLLAVDYQLDLSLCEVADQLPYVCPVAPPGHHLGNLLSVGYDEMKIPQTVRSATFLSTDSTTTYTREIPWHGRSGGALIDTNTGQLVGVVQGYEVGGSRRGMYASHGAIIRFLRKWDSGGYRNSPINLPQRQMFAPPGGPT